MLGLLILRRLRDRQQLWQHLAGIGMPPWMLRAVQAMYAQDAYMFVDGERRSGMISPTKGVKQGCPLSPLLFSLYINDLGPRLQLPGYGARIFGSARRVTHLLYADDLVLLCESARDLQRMLDTLGSYSWAKGLTVNTGKSKVVVFNSRLGGTRSHTQGGGVGARTHNSPALEYNGARLEVEPHFKYLGLVFDTNFLVCLAGPFQARLRSLPCRRPSSRLRLCTAPPGPTGRPALVTLAAPRWPALTSGSRRRPLPPPHKFTPVICWCAPPPELSPLRRSCVEDSAAGCAGPPARGALAGHLELDASRRPRMTSTAPWLSPGSAGSRIVCGGFWSAGSC